MFSQVPQILSLLVDVGSVMRNLKHQPLPVMDLLEQLQQRPTKTGSRMSINKWSNVADKNVLFFI